jgi:hypothetical protein
MARSAHPPAGVVDFATRYRENLDRAVAARMRRVGVPEAMIGFHWPGIEGGAFVRYPIPQIGANVNPYLFPGRQAAINLDLGVLDVAHPAMTLISSWATANLKDRVDAAIAHEYTEALAKPIPGSNLALWEQLHLQALLGAPATPLRITARARQILGECRSVSGH